MPRIAGDDPSRAMTDAYHAPHDIGRGALLREAVVAISGQQQVVSRATTDTMEDVPSLVAEEHHLAGLEFMVGGGGYDDRITPIAQQWTHAVSAQP